MSTFQDNRPTPRTPTNIATPQDLASIGAALPGDGCYALTTDLDLGAAADWIPLQTEAGFCLDGGGHTISNLNAPLIANLLAGSEISDLIPTKSGYTFVGWSLRPKTLKRVVFGSPILADTTLYPIFVRTVTIA